MINGKCCVTSKLLILIAVFFVTLESTAYCDRGITASGEPAREGICAVDRINGVTVPFGTRIVLPNGRVLIVKDRFGANYNNHLDIWMPTEAECWQFGRRNLVCEVIMP